MKHSDNFEHLVNEAKKNIHEISVETLAKHISQNPELLLLDVRENDEWVNGHIENAIHLPRGILERDVEKVIQDKNSELVVYCSGGFRSALACDNLQKMGYKHVLSLAGGLKDWIRKGHKITP